MSEKFETGLFAKELKNGLRAGCVWEPDITPNNTDSLFAVIERANESLAQVLHKYSVSPCCIESSTELYLFYHGLKKYFSSYDPLEVTSIADLLVVLDSSPARALKEKVMQAVGRVEELSLRLFTWEISQIVDLNQRNCRAVEILEYLGGLNEKEPNSLVLMENLIQIKNEICFSEIDSSSTVLVAGCGPMPVSAAVYALYAKKIFLVDYCPSALFFAESFIEQCPEFIRNKCEFICSDVKSIDYESLAPTHALFAGMIDNKLEMLEKIPSNSGMHCIIRQPKISLMQLFNYSVDENMLAEKFPGIFKKYSTPSGSWADLLILDLPGKDIDRSRFSSQVSNYFS